MLVGDGTGFNLSKSDFFYLKGRRVVSSVSQCKVFRNSILNCRERLYHFSSKFDFALK